MNSFKLGLRTHLKELEPEGYSVWAPTFTGTMLFPKRISKYKRVYFNMDSSSTLIIIVAAKFHSMLAACVLLC
jgi:hypothetical protein